MMKKLLLFFMMLAMAVPLWAGEQTVVINRNEGQFEESNGVYYCYKSGLMMTFTSGMNNPNYLVEHQQVYFEVMSVNTSYIIKKIVFHCVDNTLSNNLDCFYWGPTTISIVQNFYNQNAPGTYVASGYTGTWTGETNHIQFTTMAKPVRFGSVEITYEKATGDVYDLVTSDSQLQAGENYVIVNQNYDMAMSTAKTTSFSQETMDAVGVSFVDNTKAKVIINPEVQIFTLRESGETTRPWLLQLTGSNNYLRRNSDKKGTANYNTGYALYYEGLNQTYSPVRIKIGDASGDPYNARIRFKRNAMVNDYTDTCAISYVNSYTYFRTVAYSSWNTYESSQRVYMYMPAQNYEITTECDPTVGGFITLGEGVLELNGRQTSQQFQTVHFFVGTNEGYGVNSVTATDASGNPVAITCTSQGSTGNNYTMVMPASDVHIVATFADPYEIHTICTPEYGGEFTFNSGAIDVNNQVISNEGKTVTFSVDASLGYVFTGLTCTDDATGNVIALTDNGDGTYSFTMPGNDVTLSATFDRVIGDIFELVTSTDQIVEGNTYIIVSQYHDKVMKHWNKSETTFQGTPIVEWVNADKSRVRVDDNACFFRLDDCTYTADPKCSAYMNTLVGYLGYSGSNLVSTPDNSGYNRARMYISSNEHNYLCAFDVIDPTLTNIAIRYEQATNSFKMINYGHSTDERVWLYKLAETYHNISTVCNPPEGGSINASATSAQAGETVTFTVTTNPGYTFDSVTVTYTDGSTSTITVTENDGTYSFTMPDGAVTITANFTAMQAYVITTECLPNDDAGYISVYEGVSVYDDAIHAYNGSTVTFWVGTRPGWVIHAVKVTNPDTGDDVPFTMIDNQTEGGLRYQMEMPASDVHIQAIFYPYDKLYLLGTANGGDWAPNGPEFGYDPNENVYYLKVYYKGIRDVAGQDDDTMGYFSLTTAVHDTDWAAIRLSRLVAAPNSERQNPVDIKDGDTKRLYKVSDGAHQDNAFTIPAGVYILKVPVDKGSIIVKQVPLTLTLDETPDGTKINDADDVTYVSYGTQVAASSGLQAEVQHINPAEVAQTFRMSTDGGTNWNGGNTVTITTPGVTTVTGQAYIGYIIAENTGKYAYTPLGYIEDNPVGPAVVCDTLIGTWAVKNGNTRYLWAKDMGNKSIDKTYIQTGENAQIDYVKDMIHYQTKDWDQSNWVVIDFTGLEADPEEYVGYGIAPLSLVGNYVDHVNHRIALTRELSRASKLEDVDYQSNYPGYLGDYLEQQETIDYMYNHYMTPNFMTQNLNAPYGNGFVYQGESANPNLFFMNPKSQEVVHVMGVWNGNNQFSVHSRQAGINQYDLDGLIDVAWDYNRVGQDVYDAPELQANSEYVFHMAVKLIDGSQPHSFRDAKPGTASTRYVGYPLDLPSRDAIPTAVVELTAGKTIDSILYYNVMGQESQTPFDGINIEVIRYKDGSKISRKILR